jgi:drug/metabolite transporter (DMT)-like permease
MMQEFLLAQDANTVALKKSTNCVALVVKVLDALTSDTDMLRSASPSTIGLLEKNMAFIVEVMQGPCTKVQNYVVDDTPIVVYAKRIIALVHKQFTRAGFGETGTRFTLIKTLITSIKVITSLMEGRGGDDDQRVYGEVMESMNVSLFKTHAKTVFEWKNYIEKGIKDKEQKQNGIQCLEVVCSKVYDCVCSSDGVQKSKPAEPKLKPWVEAMNLNQLEQMLNLVKESAAELYTVYMQLGSINKSFLNEVTNTAGNPKFHEAYTFIDQSIKSIEFIWSGPRAPPGTQGRVDKLYFQLPPSSKALTTASKTKLFEEVNMDTDEDKKRDFLIRAKDLVAEMQHLDEVSKDPAFRFIQQNIGEIRSFSFSISVALNVLLALSVSGGGNSGFDNRFAEGYDYDNVHIRMGAPRLLFYILCGLVTIGYMLCFIYQMMIRAPLIRANYLRKRNQKAAMDDDDDDDVSTAQSNQQMLPLTGAGANTSAEEAAGGGSESSSAGDDEIKDYTNNPISPTQGGEDKKEVDALAQAKSQMDATQKAAKEKMEDTKKAAEKAAAEARKHMNRGLAALAGDPRIRRYVWKLFKTTIPFFRAVAGLLVLVLIISFTPSRPANSPAEWGWIILAVFLGTINVFFPTMMAFINELKHFPGEPLVYTLWVKSCEEFGAGFTALTELENFVPFVMMYFAIHGMFRFYMCSLLLLDVIFLNERLKNVIRAVTYTATDLAVTFILMAFVVFIFTSFGMYEFGEMIWYESDEFQAVQMDDEGDFNKGVIHSRDDDGAAFSLCPNLAVCFLEFFDSGLRSGDIVDAAFDDLTYRDNIMGYFGRIVFGLSFFLVIGVILFDIVTGIIIDKFGELREQTATRLEKIKNSTFIADIERSTCDENGLDFDDINAHDQDMWNYVYLMAYLEFKDEDEYTGAESMIAEAIEKWDISWMPQKMCWAMQLKKISAELEDSDDLISQAKEDIISDSDSKLGDLKGTNLVALLNEKFEELLDKMKKTGNGCH